MEETNLARIRREKGFSQSIENIHLDLLEERKNE